MLSALRAKEYGAPAKRAPFVFVLAHWRTYNIPHLTVDMCQIHHAELTEERLAAGANMKKQPDSVATVEMALRSLAVTARAIAWAVDKLSEALEFCAETLRRFRR